MKLLVIGDVHCHYDRYKQILNSLSNKYDKSIQVGDFGFKITHDKLICDYEVDKTKNKILFGNHDYFPYLNNLTYSLGRYGSNEDNKLFWCSGAKSIDRHRRIEGVDWFNEEMPNYIECNDIVDRYSICEPNIVITHCAPKDYHNDLINHNDSNLLCDLYDVMLNDIHKPKIWINGHYHINRIYNDNHLHIVLGELHWVIIDTIECKIIDKSF